MEFRAVRRCLFGARAANVTAVVVGGLVLIGWLVGSDLLKSVLPGGATMKPNTALCFMLLGIALALLQPQPSQPVSVAPKRRRIAQSCAGLAALIGLLTTCEYLFGVNLGLDELIFRETLAATVIDNPGRMSAATAFNFLILGVALVALDLETTRGGRPAQYLALVAVLAGLLALLGYAYGVEALYRFFLYSSMALHTSALFVALGVGALCARPERGLMTVVTSKHGGGLMARRILPVAITVPFLIGWLCLWGERAGLYETAFGLAVFALSNIVLFSFVVWMAARSLNRLDGERSRTTQALQESEENLRVTLRSIGDAVMATDAAGRVTLMNPVAESLTGWREDEARGRALSDVFHIINEETRCAVENPAARVLREGRLVGLANHTMLVVRDGTERPIADSGAPICVGHGREVSGVVLVFRDQTDERKWVQSVRESEDRFRKIAESLPQLVWTCRPDGVCDFLSRQWVEFTGVPVEAQLGFGWLAQIQPEDRGRLMERWKASVATGSLFQIEFRIRRHDGEYRWFDTRAVPVRDAEDRIVKWIGSNTEIHEQRQVREALRESEARKTAILESALDCIITADQEGRIIEFNPAAQKTFGYTPAEVVGKELAETIIPPAWREQHRRGMAHFLATGDGPVLGQRLELAALRADGAEFPVELAISVIRLKGQPMFTAYLRDITERKQAEDALRQAKESLEKKVAERTAELQAAKERAESADRAKSGFLASMSHELRTPLNAIIGFTGTLLMKLPGPLNPDQEKQLRTVQSGAKHLLSLINDLLDLAKIESGKVELNLEPVVCQSLLQDVTTALRPAAESKGLKFEVAVPQEETVVRSDRRALNQILLNLANNAIKFTECGSVRLELAQRRDGDRTLTEITVADTGVGIRAEDQAKLFQVFEQVGAASQRRHEGTGLGLHLSQKLAELLGGQITVESEFGKGSRFTLVLSDG